MKQLTKKGFWRGIYGVGIVTSFVKLMGYLNTIENSPTVTAENVLVSTMLFCGLILFGYAFTWNERR